jgi:hypothetical protein
MYYVRALYNTLACITVCIRITYTFPKERFVYVQHQTKHKRARTNVLVVS